MSDPTNGGDAAFPVSYTHPSQPQANPGDVFGGMTKREYMATKILSGIMANSIPGSHHRPDDSVSEALDRTDRLIAALNNQERTRGKP